MVNLLTDIERRQALAPGDGCSVWTSPSFDVSVYEIFSALIAGGTIQIVPEEIRADGQAFGRWLADHAIRSAYIPPFMLPDIAGWLEQNPGRSSLRRLLVGVEPIPEPLLATIDAHVPGLQIINGAMGRPRPVSVPHSTRLVPQPPTTARRRSAIQSGIRRFISSIRTFVRCRQGKRASYISAVLVWRRVISIGRS